MKKHTVFAWNSRRILIEVVDGEQAAEQMVQDMKGQLRQTYDDPRWQVVPGELQVSQMPQLSKQ